MTSTDFEAYIETLRLMDYYQIRSKSLSLAIRTFRVTTELDIQVRHNNNEYEIHHYGPTGDLESIETKSLNTQHRDHYPRPEEVPVGYDGIVR